MYGVPVDMSKYIKLEKLEKKPKKKNKKILLTSDQIRIIDSIYKAPNLGVIDKNLIK